MSYACDAMNERHFTLFLPDPEYLKDIVRARRHLEMVVLQIECLLVDLDLHIQHETVERQILGVMIVAFAIDHWTGLNAQSRAGPPRRLEYLV